MLRFADDIAVLTEYEEDIQNIFTIMNNILREEYNMKINKLKLKSSCVVEIKQLNQI